MKDIANPFAHLAEESKNDDTAIEMAVVDRQDNPYVGKAGNPIVLQVVGEYSKQYRNGEKALTNKSLKRARRNGDFDADDNEEQTLERIAYGVTGWNVEDAAGNPVSFSRSNVVLFLKAAPWMAPKIDAKIKGHADFFRRASDS